jgi:hypothetical protein
VFHLRADMIVELVSRTHVLQLGIHAYKPGQIATPHSTALRLTTAMAWSTPVHRTLVRQPNYVLYGPQLPQQLFH